jgi:hypothetical protein
MLRTKLRKPRSFNIIADSCCGILLCVSDSEKEKKYKLVKLLSCISLTDDPCAAGTTFKGIVYHLEEFSVRHTLG